ncbi:MAG: hypothetical protein Q9173_005134 [Seirophora scorigena]
MASSIPAHRHPPPTPSAFAPSGMPTPNGLTSASSHAASRGPPLNNNNNPTTQPVSVSNPPGGDPPRPDNNLMNIRGDMTSSLYQICLTLRRRLSHVPGFHQYLAEMEEEEAEAEGATDPVTTMWNCLRRGYPLMTIYNALKPHNPLNVDANRVAEKSIGKAATFKFLQACLTDLKIPANECFLITDLYGSDTTGFVKVTKVVNRVLDKLDERGLLLPSDPRYPDLVEGPGSGGKITHIQHVVREIVTSERTYVQHLEVLQQAKNEIEAAGNVPGDSIHDIFLNLNTLLDFQRRFLIRIEQQNSLPESQQNWGQLFIQYKDSFRVYEPFIANQNRCNDTVTREWEKINTTPHSQNLDDLFSSPAVFHAFCVKPFQRLSKYPLLLAQLGQKSDLDEERKADLIEGEAAASSLMQRANEAVAKEQRTTAVSDLQLRVEDWKGHNMKQFGELLLYGNFTVVKGEGTKPAERESEGKKHKSSSIPLEQEGILERQLVNPSREQYIIYLFERILLCCKEVNPNKQRPKMLRNERAPVTLNGKVRLQLKGRIFMQNVTDVLSFVRTEKSSYTIQIFWKGDPGVENFVIRFSNENEMNKWRDQVQQQKQSLGDSARSSGQTGTSETMFTSMKNLALLENPHLQMEDPDDDDDSSYTNSQSNFGPANGSIPESSMSRNASSNSLRAVNNQVGGMTGRVPPSRLANPDHIAGIQPPLSLNTNLLPGASTPGEFPGNSYFSPAADSPSSTRSSSQAATYPFPRQGTPVDHWPHEDKKHKTAPAQSGLGSRDGPIPPNAYQMNGRTVMRPSLPVMSPSQAAQHLAMTQRMRSASTPNIHDPTAAQGNGTGARRYANGQVQPSVDSVPVPPIPSHMRTAPNRSRTNSPTNGPALTRSATQSPMLPRDRPGQHPEQNNYNPTSHRQYAPHPEQRSHMQENYPPAPITVLKSPPVPIHTTSENDIPLPSQLKVSIWFQPPPSHVTIVVPIVIKHRSLIDRIDSKMSKISSASISKGTARLRYKDIDDDFVTIGSDEDVQLAIDDWGQANEEDLRNGDVPDFELHWEEKGSRPAFGSS